MEFQRSYGSRILQHVGCLPTTVDRNILYLKQAESDKIPHSTVAQVYCFVVHTVHSGRLYS